MHLGNETRQSVHEIFYALLSGGRVALSVFRRAYRDLREGQECKQILLNRNFSLDLVHIDTAALAIGLEAEINHSGQQIIRQHEDNRGSILVTCFVDGIPDAVQSIWIQ